MVVAHRSAPSPPVRPAARRGHATAGPLPVVAAPPALSHAACAPLSLPCSYSLCGVHPRTPSPLPHPAPTQKGAAAPRLSFRPHSEAPHGQDPSPLLFRPPPPSEHRPSPQIQPHHRRRPLSEVRAAAVRSPPHSPPPRWARPHIFHPLAEPQGSTELRRSPPDLPPPLERRRVGLFPPPHRRPTSSVSPASALLA
jgi:hypothetical protein